MTCKNVVLILFTLIYVTNGFVSPDQSLFFASHGHSRLRFRRELDPSEDSDSEELKSEPSSYYNRDFCISGTSSLIQVTSSEPIIQLVRAGSTVTLRCANSDEGLSGRAQWTKSNGEIPRGRSRNDGQGVLTISNIKAEDTGSYTCTITDGYSTHSDHLTLLVEDLAGTSTFPEPNQNHVQPTPSDPRGSPREERRPQVDSSYGDKPQVSINPHYLQVDVGAPVEFTCTALGYPPVESLAWRGGRSGTLPSHVQVQNGVLKISSARKSDEAEYHCDATNSLGTTSARTILYVSGEDSPEAPTHSSPSLSTPRRNENLEEESGGTKVYIPQEEERPAITLRPLIPQRPQIQPPIQHPQQPQHQYDPSRERQRPDPQPTSPAPAVRIEPERQTVAQGSPIEIRCIAYNSPNPSITWTKVGTDASLPDNIDTSSETLKIPAAQMTDRGVYVCTVESSNGKSLASALVEVERREAPQIEIYPSTHQTINQEGSALFQCRVIEGIPNPRITWTRIPAEGDSSPRATQMPTNVEEIQGGVLRFNRVTGEEKGQYLCTAESVAGRATAVASLNIQIFPVVTISPSTPHRLTTGERVKLECQATGDPAPRLSWKRLLPGQLDGADLQTRTVQVSEYVVSSTYELNRVDKENEGSYSCSAENEAGLDEQRIQLLVDDPAEVLPGRQSPSGQDEGQQQPSRQPQNPYWPFETPSQPQRPPQQHYDPHANPESHAQNPYDQSHREPDHGRTEGEEDPQVLIPATRDLTVVEGSRAVLKCNAPSSRGARINWRKGDGSLPLAAVPIGNTLNIMFVSAADQGRYICSTDQGSDYVDLTVVTHAPEEPRAAVTPNQSAGQERGYQCQPDEWKCRTVNQCIPTSQHCDNEIDCTDGSDELYCSRYRAL